MAMDFEDRISGGVANIDGGQRQSEATDRQIDAPAYALYGLTAGEVAVVG